MTTRKRLRPVPVVAMLLAPLCIGSTARAELWQTTFSGVITEIEIFDGLPDIYQDVEIGSSWEFSYIADGETEDLIPTDPLTGFFLAQSATVIVAGVSQSSEVVELEVRRGGLFDTFDANVFDLPVGGGGAIQLSGPSDLFDTDQLPFSFELDDFSLVLFELGIPNQALFRGSIDSSMSRVVPTPSGILVLIAVVATSMRRRIR